MPDETADEGAPSRTHTLAIRWPTVVYEAIQAIAEREERTVTQQFVYAVRQWLAFSEYDVRLFAELVRILQSAPPEHVQRILDMAVTTAQVLELERREEETMESEERDDVL